MNLKESIDADAAINTQKRTGYLMDACIDDAKLKQGLWQPMDTLPVVAFHFAKAHPKLAMFWIKLFVAFNGQKEV